jgi:hypothetical protein
MCHSAERRFNRNGADLQKLSNNQNERIREPFSNLLFPLAAPQLSEWRAAPNGDFR